MAPSQRSQFLGIPLADELLRGTCRALLHPQVSDLDLLRFEESPNERLLLDVLAEQHDIHPSHGERPRSLRPSSRDVFREPQAIPGSNR